jgi:hypothetical protein
MTKYDNMSYYTKAKIYRTAPKKIGSSHIKIMTAPDYSGAVRKIYDNSQISREKSYKSWEKSVFHK